MAKHENCTVPNCPVCKEPKTPGVNDSPPGAVRAVRTTSTSTHSGLPGEAYNRIFRKNTKQPEEPLINDRPRRRLRRAQ